MMAMRARNAWSLGLMLGLMTACLWSAAHAAADGGQQTPAVISSEDIERALDKPKTRGIAFAYARRAGKPGESPR